jgi:hypothetical protein
VVGVTFSSSKADAVATLCPDCPEQGLVSHGMVGQATPSSLWVRGVEKSSGLVLDYLSKVLERYERAEVKKFSSGLWAAEEPGLGQWRDHHSQRQGQGDQAEAGG